MFSFLTLSNLVTASEDLNMFSSASYLLVIVTVSKPYVIAGLTHLSCKPSLSFLLPSFCHSCSTLPPLSSTALLCSVHCFGWLISSVYSSQLHCYFTVSSASHSLVHMYYALFLLNFSPFLISRASLCPEDTSDTFLEVSLSTTAVLSHSSCNS